MAERYGTTPTDIMDQPFTDFWIDAGVTAAVNDWREDQQAAQQAAQTDAGTAAPHQKDELVQAQEQRADRREQADAPSPAEQVAAMGLDGGDI